MTRYVAGVAISVATVLACACTALLGSTDVPAAVDGGDDGTRSGSSGGSSSGTSSSSGSSGGSTTCPTCSELASCVSGTCQCNDGYTGDGTSCTSLCGDGVCESTQGETCGSCPQDCGQCSCSSCSSAGSCQAGNHCLFRICDGLPGCYPENDASAVCAEVGGVACPGSNMYDACDAGVQCGTPADVDASGMCTVVDDQGDMVCPPQNFCGVNGHCGRLWCTGAAGCVPLPPGSTGVTIECVEVQGFSYFATSPVQPPCSGLGCGGGSGFTRPNICALKCTTGAKCPYGLTCQSDAGGYCN